jgi:hypothetical protein
MSEVFVKINVFCRTCGQPVAGRSDLEPNGVSRLFVEPCQSCVKFAILKTLRALLKVYKSDNTIQTNHD